MTVVPDPSGSARNARGQAEGEEGAGFPWRMVSASVLTISVAMLPGFLPGALAIQLADDFDISVATVTNRLAAARRVFRRLLLAKLREMTGSDEEFRSEARSLLGTEPG